MKEGKPSKAKELRGSLSAAALYPTSVFLMHEIDPLFKQATLSLMLNLFSTYFSIPHSRLADWFLRHF